MRTQLRKRKNFLNNYSEFFKKFYLQIFNLNMPRGITIAGVLTAIVSLFMPWIIIENADKIINKNAFNAIAWNIWYIIFLLLFIITFLVFGWNYKEKMKLYSEIDVKNYLVILFTGLFMIIAWFMCINFSFWLEVFWWKDVKYWNWVILSITAAIIIIAWGYLTRKEFYKNSSEIILENMNKERNKNKTKENMKLPF